MENENSTKEEGSNMIITNPDTNYGRTETLYSPALLDKQMRSIFITIPKSYQDKSAIFNNLKTSSKSLTYVLVAQEKHKDNTPHIHIHIEFKNPVKLKVIHAKIISVEGNIGGSINYQQVNNSEAVNNYVRKDDETSLEFGKRKNRLSRRPQYDIDGQNMDMKTIIDAGDKMTTEEKLDYIKERQPLMYMRDRDKIKNMIEEEEVIPKWDLPTMENVKLRPYQQQIWDLINQPPVARRIIWVYGKPNQGKSFMYNYLEQHYKYKVYCAGQSASLDNVVYGYNEEGAIIWDIPKSYNWENEELVNTLASTIEKFSDFGTTITSKKYTGKKAKVRGHAIVFSNHRPIEQLKHRDIVEIVAGERTINSRYRVEKNDEKQKYIIHIDNYTTKYFYNRKDYEQFIEETYDYYED